MLPAGMILSPAPDLPLVVGLPFLLLLGMSALIFGLWVLMGRLGRP
jgi:hypothetical protein